MAAYTISYFINGFSLALTALLTPLLVVTMTFQDVFASSEQPELFEDPLVGQNVTAIVLFKRVGNGYEGRVLLNGATWNAHCNEVELPEGARARVSQREGQLLYVEPL